MLFDSTVRKELARSFGATVVVILTIVLTMMLIRTLGLAANGQVSPQDVALMLCYTSLGQLPTMLTLSYFVAVVVSLGRMYRDSEMAIWFSSGIGLSRFMRPVLLSGWPVLLVVALLTLIAWPWSNQKMTELRTRYEQRSDIARVSPGSFQSSNDGSRVFFIERAGDFRIDGAGVGRNVFLMGQHEGNEAVTTARAGRIEQEGTDQVLRLDSGQRTEFNRKTSEHVRVDFERFRTVVDAIRATADQARPPKALMTPELMLAPTPRNLGELTWRLGVVLATGNILILGIGTAATNPRRANNWNLLFALLAYVVYSNLVNLSQAWVNSGRVGMWPVLLVLHGGTLAFALGLIWWRDHAAVKHFGWSALKARKPA